MYKRLIVVGIMILSLMLTSCSDNSSTDTVRLMDNTVADVVSKDISLDGTVIVSVSSELNNTHIDSLLIPSHEALLRIYGPLSDDVKVRVQTRNSTIIVDPLYVSEVNRSISFVAPASTEDGELALIQGGTVLSTLPYTIYKKQNAYITKVVSTSVVSGADIRVTGVNLSAMEFASSTEGNFTVPVSASETSAIFTVPSNAKAGYFKLTNKNYETNSLYLNVKQGVDVVVEVTPDLEINASSIGFVVAAKEYVLDPEYRVHLDLNNNLNYIHASAERSKDEFEYLFSGVVLPNIKGEVKINADSTAIAWIFMGMGAVSKMDDTQLQAFYERLSSNTKVKELAQYIVSLQKSDFEKWAAQSDEMMKEKYKEALTDVLEKEHNYLKSTPSRATTIDNNYLKIIQEPLNEDIYVNNTKYGYVLNSELTNGSVTLVNDTMSYMSVEARAVKDASVINGYQHVTNIVDMEQKALISPKSGYFLGISSSKEIVLQGEDASLEIIIAAYNGETDKPNLSGLLLTRTQIDGVLVPSLDMMLSALVDRTISEDNLFKKVVSGMSDIYGADFLVAFTTRAVKKDASTTELVQTFVITPISNGFSSCLALPPGETCRTMISGIGHLMGYSQEYVEEQLWKAIIQNLVKRGIKRAATAVPVLGWIAGTASFIYDNMDYIKNTGMITETYIDLTSNPREINVDVDFKLRIDEVAPMCIPIVPNYDQFALFVKGEGFSMGKGTTLKVVFMDDELSESEFSIVDNSYSNTDIFAAGKANEVGSKGSTKGHVFLKYSSGLSAMYPQELRVVDQNDEVVYFDAIEPDRGVARAEVTLKGCGWLPLDDISVIFKSTEGEVEANITKRDEEEIVVQVPDDAVDGSVYVKAGIKKTKNIYFDVEEFGLIAAQEKVLEPGTELVIDGRGLETVDKVMFIDSSGDIKEGVVDMTLPSPTFIIVQVPSTLNIGPVDVYAVKKDGIESNALHLKRLPSMVGADPDSQGFEDSITVSLVQAEGADIYFHKQSKEPELYRDPITIKATDVSMAEGYILTAFARVVVDGVNYDSQESQFTYLPVSSKCPLKQDTSLHGYHYLNQSWLQAKDTNGDGFFDDYLLCSYYSTSSKLAREDPYIQNKRHGITREFFESGSLKFEGRYENGLEEGAFITKYENGTLKSKVNYIDGAMDGLAEGYYENQQPAYEINYKNGTYDGVYKKYKEGETAEDPSVLWIYKNYTMGRQTGVERRYFDDGSLEYEGEWMASTNPSATNYSSKKDGVWKEFYEDPYARKSLKTYKATRDGNGDVISVLEGLYELYFPNGVLSYTGNYVNDKEEGVWYSYYETSGAQVIKTKSTYVQGVKEGTYFIYFEDPNRVQKEYQYVKGVKEGSYVEYYDTGQTYMTGYYHNDEKDGQFKVYNRDTGEMTSCSIYVNGNYSDSCMPD